MHAQELASPAFKNLPGPGVTSAVSPYCYTSFMELTIIQVQKITGPQDIKTVKQRKKFTVDKNLQVSYECWIIFGNAPEESASVLAFKVVYVVHCLHFWQQGLRKCSQLWVKEWRIIYFLVKDNNTVVIDILAKKCSRLQFRYLKTGKYHTVLQFMSMNCNYRYTMFLSIKDTSRSYSVKFTIENNQLPGGVGNCCFIKFFNHKHL